MRQPHPPQKSKSTKDRLTAAQDWIAGIAAGVICFIGSPLAHKYSVEHLMEFTRQYYSESLIGVIYIAWWGIVAVGIYFLANTLILSWVRAAVAKYYIQKFQ